MIKRLISTLAIGGVVVAASVAAAATLDFTDPQPVVQANSVTDVSCDEDGVNVEGFGVELDDLSGHNFVVSGIDDDCIGRTLAVKIVDGSGAQLEKAAAVITATSLDNNEVSIPINPAISLEAIEGFNIVIG